MRSLCYWAVRRRSRVPARARGLCRAITALALALTGLAAVTGPPTAGAATTTRATPVTATVSKDETTASDNDLRDGWDPNEPTLTPAAVTGPDFGQVFRTKVSGQLYAQPLVVGNTVIVATEADWVYGLNATTGTVEWSTSLGAPYHITNCGDLTPDIGITSTPVYDPSTGTVYVMAMVKEISYQFRLFGLNVSTGAITLKHRIAGSPSNDKHITFSPIPQNQRAGLLLRKGWVYAAFASHCDHQPYAGYVAGVHVAQRPLKTTLWTDEAGVSDDQAGIWQSGGGLMSTGPDNIYFTSGNGISPAKGPGSKPPGQLAESVVRLRPRPDGSLQARDFFSPANAPQLDAGDKDFGSGGPAGLPFGTSTYPDIVAQAGKYGRLYLLDAGDLGGRKQSSVGGDQDLFRIGNLAGQWGHPGIFGDTATLTASNASKASDYLYYLGTQDYLRAFKFGVNRSDRPTLTDTANSTFTLGYASGSPVVTSNGTDASSAVVWVVDSPDQDGDGKDASLIAFDALPRPKSGGGTKLREIWTGDIGTAAKFTIAATDNGMVYVGTRDGRVYGFGRTSGGALKRSRTVTFPDTTVHSATTRPVTVTATRTVTVTGASIRARPRPAPFTISRVTLTRPGGSARVPVKFPVTLHRGEELRAQVRFAPGAVGGASGSVSFATIAGPVPVPLVGDGTRTGLFATSTSLSFVLNTNDGVITNVPAGISTWAVTSIVNGGDTPVRVASVKAPTGPYTAAGLPTPGTVIKPGAAIPVQVQFAPAHPGAATSSLTVTSSKGDNVTVTLSGAGLRPVTRFISVPSRVNFGSVRVGHTAKIWVNIVNRGNQSALMSGASTQGGPFRAQFRIAKGLPVNSTYDLTVPIIFTPRKAGPFHGRYQVTWRDAQGAHTLEVPVSGTGVS